MLYYNIIILWDYRRICGPSLSETSLCGAYLYQQVLDAAYKLPEDGTDVPKPVDVAEDYTFKCVCNLCIMLAS